MSKAGVNYYTEYRKTSKLTWEIYVDKLTDFHQCPMVKMCYDFVSIVNISFTTVDSNVDLKVGYIWLLLVFSYMLLFKLAPRSETGYKYHWTEIYIIVTISTMLIEDMRQVRIYYLVLQI